MACKLQFISLELEANKSLYFLFTIFNLYFQLIPKRREKFNRLISKACRTLLKDGQQSSLLSSLVHATFS